MDYPDNKPVRPDLPPGMKPHKRPKPRDPLVKLMRLREEKFPGMMQRDFAEKYLGVTRLHMYYVESGRRQPSLELALRWIEALAPKARLSMFGPLPLVEKRIREIKRLQKIAPEIFQAA